MNSDQLKQFIVVAETQNLRVASDILFMTTPAIHRTISILESELQCQLFNRIGRSIYLNRNGQKLLQYAKTVRDTLEEAETALLTDTLNNPITILSFAPAYFTHILPNIESNKINYQTQTVHKLNPVGDLNLLFTDEIQAIIDYDRPIYSINGETLIKKQIFQEESAIYIPIGHKWYERNAITLNEMIGENFFCSEDDLVWQEEFMRNYHVHFNLKTYDRYSFVYAYYFGKEPLLHVSNPDDNYFLIEKNKDMQTRKVLPIENTAKRPLYLFFLAQNADKLEPFLRNSI